MQPISVLVVDSNLDFLRFIVRYIQEQHDASVRVVGTAFCLLDALLLKEATHPQVILVGMSGPIDTALALITELRRLPAVTVVAMSQLGAAGYAEAALAAGAVAFVDKDRVRSDLVSALLHVAEV